MARDAPKFRNYRRSGAEVCKALSSDQERFFRLRRDYER
jgi:hypothetical protein